MRPKSLLLLALALGCGLIASIGISQVMEGRNQKPTTIEKEPIYIAKVNINTGDPIDSEMVMLKEWPKTDIPPGAIRELVEIEDRRPRTPIFQGEAILESKLLHPGESSDPTQHIPKGFRIVPISVRADTGAAGLLRPGDRVDVQWYVARNPRIGVNETVSKTILHNVRVFAVDQAVTRPMSGDEAPMMAKTISLLLDPKQANMVQLATKVGEVSLIPRHPDDPSTNVAARVTFEDLVLGSGASNRLEEQGRRVLAGAPGGGFFSGLMSRLAAGAATSSAVEPLPPFEMEMVIGDKIHHERFDAETGKPLRNGAVSSGPGVGRPVSFPAGVGSGSTGVGSGPEGIGSESGLPGGEIPITYGTPEGGATDELEALTEKLKEVDLSEALEGTVGPEGAVGPETEGPGAFPIDFGE